MKKHIFIKAIIKVTLFCLLFFCGLSNTKTIYADTLQYFDAEAGSFITYSGKPVKYTYNDFEVSLSRPGILINGTALADYNELFVNELGISAQQLGNDILFSDAGTNVLVSINSKTAWVNGTEYTMNVAPVMVYTGEDVRYYVPTRFLAESFGFDYVWLSSSSTVQISKEVTYSVNNEILSANTGFYRVCYNNNFISGDMPVFTYNGIVIAPLEQVFKAMGCDYTEEENSLYITKNNLKLVLDKSSKVSYINNKKIIAEDVPVQIKNHSSGEQKTCASLEFVAKMLGYEISLDTTSNIFTIIETGNTGIYPAELYGRQTGLAKSIYYEWCTENSAEIKPDTLSKIIAYPQENYDVVELYGISSENIVSFFDNGTVVFEVRNTENALGTQFYSDYASNRLNYTLLTDVNNSTRLYFIAGPEDKWKISDAGSYVQVIFFNDSEEFKEPDIKTVNYPDDKLIIPLEEQVSASDISDKDNYLENNFEIRIKGNHLGFYEQNSVINPYFEIKNCEFIYDETADTTIVKIFTNIISAYSYTIENGYLSVSVGRPKEFYSKIIVLDAGHGGIDPGASKNGIKEKDLNFTILNTYTKDIFALSDIKVYFTRETDVKIDLYERAAFASKINADMFISLHMNANNSSSVKGTEVFYSAENNNTSVTGFNSALLAKTLANNISAEISTKNRGASKSDFVVVKYNTVPAVLIELGYMTNSSELEKLKNSGYQQKTAEAIYNTVSDLFNGYLFR